MEGLIQVKSHLEIIRSLALFIIHKLRQVLQNMEAWFDDDNSRAAQHECNHSVWCSHHCQLGAFPCEQRFHPSADDEITGILPTGLTNLKILQTHLGTTILIWGSLLLNQQGRGGERECLSGRNSRELARWNRWWHNNNFLTWMSLPQVDLWHHHWHRADGCGELYLAVLTQGCIP